MSSAFLSRAASTAHVTALGSFDVRGFFGAARRVTLCSAVGVSAPLFARVARGFDVLAVPACVLAMQRIFLNAECTMQNSRLRIQVDSEPCIPHSEFATALHRDDAQGCAVP